MLTLAYITLAVLGAGYIVVSAFLGHLGDVGGHGGDHAAGHHDAGDSYGVEGGGHGKVSAGDLTGTAFHFPFFSPLALSTLFAGVGAFGLIGQYALRLGDLASLAVAFPAAIATSYAVTYGAWKIVASSRGSSALRAEEFAGALGEVAAVVGGQRFTAPAREASGQALARGTPVKVVRMVGSTIVVTTEAK